MNASLSRNELNDGLKGMGIVLNKKDLDHVMQANSNTLSNHQSKKGCRAAQPRSPHVAPQ